MKRMEIATKEIFKKIISMVPESIMMHLKIKLLSWSSIKASKLVTLKFHLRLMSCKNKKHKINCLLFRTLRNLLRLVLRELSVLYWRIMKTCIAFKMRKEEMRP